MVIQRTPTKIDKIVSLRIGQHQENAATQIKMDVSDWITVHPTAGFHILFKRPGEVQAQPVLSSLEDGILTWTVQAWETALIGVGYAEVRAIEAESALVAKSRVIPCSVEESIAEDGEVPPEYSGWVERILNVAELADDLEQSIADGIEDIQAEGTTQVGNVNSAGTTQVGAVQAKGTEVLNSIPADYSTLSGDVSGLKSAIDKNAENIKTASEIAFSQELASWTMQSKKGIYCGETTIKTTLGSNFYLSTDIPVVAGELYKLSCASYGPCCFYAFGDDNGIISTYPSESMGGGIHTVTDIIVSVPTNATKLYISGYKNSGVTASATKYVTNLIKMMNYVGNPYENKLTSVEWLNGYRVYAIDQNQPRMETGYSIASFDVAKGDLVLVTYESGHSLSGSAIALSEKINYGSGSLQYGFRFLISSGIGTISYIAEKAMTMIVTGQNGHLPSITVYSMPVYASDIDIANNRYMPFPYNETTQRLMLTKRDRNNHGTSYSKPLRLLHYSDNHNFFRGVDEIAYFVEHYGEYLDDVIHSGDMSGTFANYIPIYSLERYKDILLAIGNHDVYDADGTHDSDAEAYWATNLQKYNQYFAPSIANWNVTQPDDASTNGLCYYYKDYADDAGGAGFRLIVLDAMAYDDAQHNWFVSVLASAKTSEKTVVVSEHFPPITGLSDITGFNTPFMSLLSGMEYNYAETRLKTTAGSAIDAVDDFIDDGGEFACWLCGHMHYDQIGKITTHPKQIFIAIASNNNNGVWEDMPREINTPSDNLFNVISIDPYYKLLKVQRFGAVVDDWGRMHDHVVVNYQTGTLVSTS